jgi:hypothetical protein
VVVGIAFAADPERADVERDAATLMRVANATLGSLSRSYSDFRRRDVSCARRRCTNLRIAILICNVHSDVHPNVDFDLYQSSKTV